MGSTHNPIDPGFLGDDLEKSVRKIQTVSLRYIASHYGIDAQMNKAQEELAELIQSISKLRLAGSDASKREKAMDSVSEEMADVLIMVEQLIHLMQNAEEVRAWRVKKINRTLKNIEEENNND